MFYITPSGHQLHSIPELQAFLQGRSGLSLLSIFKNISQPRGRPLNSPSATLFRSVHVSQKSHPGHKHIYNNSNNNRSAQEDWLGQSLTYSLTSISGDNGHRKQWWQQSITSHTAYAPASLQFLPHAVLSTVISELCVNHVASPSNHHPFQLLNLVNPIPCRGSGIQNWTFSASLAVCMH